MVADWGLIIEFETFVLNLHYLLVVHIFAK